MNSCVLLGRVTTKEGKNVKVPGVSPEDDPPPPLAPDHTWTGAHPTSPYPTGFTPNGWKNGSGIPEDLVEVHPGEGGYIP